MKIKERLEKFKDAGTPVYLMIQGNEIWCKILEIAGDEVKVDKLNCYDKIHHENVLFIPFDQIGYVRQ